MIFFKHVLFRAAVSYQAGSLLMSSRLGRARLYSTDWEVGVGGRCRRNAKVLSVLFTVNSRDKTYPAYLLMRALQSEAISYSCRKKINPAHADNNGADDILLTLFH